MTKKWSPFGFCDDCTNERDLVQCEECNQYYCDDCVNAHIESHYYWEREP